MEFEPYQRRFKLESILKFTNCIKFIICKSQKDIAKYYNQRYISIPVFHPNNKMFLDFSNIHIIYFSTKLSHHLKSYMVEK